MDSIGFFTGYASEEEEAALAQPSRVSHRRNLRAMTHMSHAAGREERTGEDSTREGACLAHLAG